jgi:hypothetical protein
LEWQQSAWLSAIAVICGIIKSNKQQQEQNQNYKLPQTSQRSINKTTNTGSAWWQRITRSNYNAEKWDISYPANSRWPIMPK